jgi:electron transfer flavoprotein beta subunit
MKIAVCLKEVIDTTIDLGYGRVGETLLQKGLARRLNPVDAQALAEALALKAADPGNEITLISLGPESAEDYLRDGIALGADKAVRIWEESLSEVTPYQTARILTSAVKLAGADLVLVGAASLDNASGLVGPLMAAWLGCPCVCEAIAFRIEKKALTVTRRVSKGVKENLLTSLPAVIAVADSAQKLPYVSLENVMAGQEASITHLTLADLGISPSELYNDPTGIVGTGFPRPRPKPVSYDSSLPAFYRILALLQGGITKRRGEILQGGTDELVNQLYDLLVKEEVIKPTSKS